MNLDLAFNNNPLPPHFGILNKKSNIPIEAPSYEDVLKQFDISYDELVKFEINESELTDNMKCVINKIEILGERIKNLRNEISELQKNIAKIIGTRSAIETNHTSLIEMFNKSSYFSASKKLEIESYVMNSAQHIISNISEMEHSAAKELNTAQTLFNQLNETYSKVQSLLRSSILASSTEAERVLLCSKNICNICVTNNINSAYECGHVFCLSCTLNCGLKCPTCRQTSTKTIKLYMDSNNPVTSSDIQPFSTSENQAAAH